jgi:hypothetical protein
VEPRVPIKEEKETSLLVKTHKKTSILFFAVLLQSHVGGCDIETNSTGDTKHEREEKRQTYPSVLINTSTNPIPDCCQRDNEIVSPFSP